MQLGDPPRDISVQRVIGGLPECRLRRVTAYIEGNLHGDLSLARLAAVIHMSPYHFARLFNQATGVSPHRFVLQRRIRTAATLLGDSTSSITAIARTVGFTTTSHFSTTFRRITGLTPTAYRCGRATNTRHQPMETTTSKAISVTPHPVTSSQPCTSMDLPQEVTNGTAHS